jgi:hypothetical protein
MRCDICNGTDEGNTCCDEPLTLHEKQVAALARYMLRVVPEGKQSVAHEMLALWDRPWSGTALKFATWALHRARRAGCDVLENPRVMESMDMAAAGW